MKYFALYLVYPATLHVIRGKSIFVGTVYGTSWLWTPSYNSWTVGQVSLACPWPSHTEFPTGNTYCLYYITNWHHHYTRYCTWLFSGVRQALHYILYPCLGPRMKRCADKPVCPSPDTAPPQPFQEHNHLKKLSHYKMLSTKTYFCVG